MYHEATATVQCTYKDGQNAYRMYVITVRFTLKTGKCKG